jgi:hypothetical protein
MALRKPHLGAAVDRFRIEAAVGAEVTATRPVDRAPQIDGRVGIGRLLALLALYPVRARYRSSRPGAKLSPRSVPTVLPPTQYSRRLGCSAAYRIALATTSGW